MDEAEKRSRKSPRSCDLSHPTKSVLMLNEAEKRPRMRPRISLEEAKEESQIM